MSAGKGEGQSSGTNPPNFDPVSEYAKNQLPTFDAESKAA